MVQYDPRVIQQFAERLYSQATAAIVTWTILGIPVGMVGGFMLAASLRAEDAWPFRLVGGLALGALGFMVGLQRAAAFRMQAQVALCQLQIEANTRRA